MSHVEKTVSGEPKIAVRVSEACKRLDLGKTTLYGLIAAGRIRTVKIGERGVRIPVSELERFVREGLQPEGYRG